MVVKAIIRKQEYRDSVVLLEISKKIQTSPGILDAVVVMGTSSNKEILSNLEMLTEEISTASANDLIIVFKAVSDEAVQRVVSNLGTFFERGDEVQTKKTYTSFESAIEGMPEAKIAVISVPGEFAAREARQALKKGLLTIVFSDNVPVEDEVAIKQMASDLGLFVFGPDCGVCNLSEIAFVLASRVAKGPVGIVGASGSGVQELYAILDQNGVGISQAIGTGGRDLSDEVSAMMMVRGIELLEADPETQLIALVGKVPSNTVLQTLIQKTSACTKPVVVCFLNGQPQPWADSGVYFAPTMDFAGQIVTALVHNEAPAPRLFSMSEESLFSLLAQLKGKLHKNQKYIRGIFGGGTFVAQAQVILQSLLQERNSNSPFAGGKKLGEVAKSIGHTFVDLGDEEFTRGRAHPVIDMLPYQIAILREMNDPETAVILVDVILGPAVHSDPAGYICNAIEKARQKTSNRPVIIASVCGTKSDPQNIGEQIQKLKSAGVIVLPSSAQAAALAGILVCDKTFEDGFNCVNKLVPHNFQDIHTLPVTRIDSQKGHSFFPVNPKVINIGVKLLADSLESQGVEVAQVTWAPPAGGEVGIIRLLDRLNADEVLQAKIKQANDQVFKTIVDGQPVWKDAKPAGEVIPGFRKNMIAYPGPEIDIDDMVSCFQEGVLGAAIVEGLAGNHQEAYQKVKSGSIELVPAWEYNVPIAGMAGVSASMIVMVCEDIAHGTYGFSPIMEGPSYEALRSGVYNEVVHRRWNWFRTTMGPVLSSALQKMSGINLRQMISRSLLMGDELHTRETACTALILGELAPQILALDWPKEELRECLDFIRVTERFSQNILIAGSAAVLKSIANVPYSSVVIGMGGNGVEMGIRISQQPEETFCAPAPQILGRYINPNTKPEDTVPFAGDSCMVTVYGLGACAAAASPSVTVLGGGTVQDASNRTRDMWKITTGRNPNYAIANLNFEGVPTGIDIIKILESNILPVSHAGMVLKKGGLAGAGNARVPFECFKKGFVEFAKQIGIE